MKVFLLVSFVLALLPNIEGSRHGEMLLIRLDREIHRMDRLIAQIERHYRNLLNKNPGQTYPRNYESTLNRASATTAKALKLIKNIKETNRRAGDENYEDVLRNSLSIEKDRNSDEPTRRNNDLEWKTNVYKALSRALKDEFPDNEMIQENVKDGFEPPLLMKKRGEQ